MEIVRANWTLVAGEGEPPIQGDLRAPTGPPPETAIVLCHGFKGFKDWGFFPRLAATLAARGHAVLSFNLSRSGVGDDGVDFSALERFEEQTHSRNLREIRLVLDAVGGGPLFPRAPRRIGLFGHSRGGGEALLTASRDPRVAALVTWSAIAKVGRYEPEQIAAWERGESIRIPNARTGQEMPVGPAFWEDIRQHPAELDIEAAARRVRVPWLLVHGESDETVPIEEARMLLAWSGSPATELLTVEGAGHTFGAVHPFAEETPELAAAISATTRWFDRHLGTTG